MVSLTRFPIRFASLGFAVACVAFWSAVCQASPPYVIDVWTPYQGLPQSRVLSIAQTPDGYLWVGTKFGWLARFDGLRFVQFSSDDTSALGSPEIHKLLIDDHGILWISDIDGRLIQYANGVFENKAAIKPGADKRVAEWIGRQGNENRFVTVTNTLIRVGATAVYENENNSDPKAGHFINQFCQDGDGVLWCRNWSGVLGRWVDRGFKPESDPSLPAGLKVNYLLPSSKGTLLLATSDGLWKRAGGVFSRIPLELAGTGTPILQLARNPDGGIWLRTQGAVILVRDNTIVLTAPLTGLDSRPQTRQLEMHADSRGGVWVVKSGSGVWHVDDTGVLTVLSAQNGLPSDQVETWFEDREKNIWLGTAGGLVRLRPRWFDIVGTDSSGPGSEIVSICEDAGGSIWLGRANGLTRWDQGVTANLPIPAIRGQIPVADVTVAPGELPGEVWLGTVPSGTVLLRGNRIEQPFPYAAAGIAIRVIRRDPVGGIWFGSEFGLFRWDGKALRKFGPEEGLKEGHIFDISFDTRGTPWVAKAENLLSVFRDGRFESIPLPGLSPSLRINTVLCGSEGSVWLGTVGAGLVHLTGGKVIRYTTDDGLPGNSVTQLLEDDHGYLWGGTHQGIFRVSTTALDMRSKGVKPPFLFQSYGHADGLTTAECSGGLQPGCWKARDGQLWFSTSGGAVRINPEKVRKNFNPPNVVIEEMRVNEQVVHLGRNRDDPAANTLGPGRHRYEFQFTAINFTAPEKIRFQWKLSGVDSDWVDGGRDRNVAYSGLDPGDHHFAVRACNNDGVWSQEAASVHFHVTPFLWQRPAVKAVFVMIGLALAYLGITGIMRRQHLRELRDLEYARSLEQQRFRHKQAMENERSRIAAELHDDLGANLTQIQWLGDAATRAQGSSAGENEILNRITRKTRDMVRLIDEIVWAVNPKNDTLEQLVTYVCNFAEQYFRDSPTRCRIDVADDIPVHKLEADVRHHLFLIAKEALHNVAKHGATDRVWVRVNCDGGVFSLLVEDRGCGYDPASIEAGNGLANMRNRARLAEVDLTIESSPGSGTRVELLMKLKPESN